MVIFICTFDPFAKKLPIYTLKIFCEEDKSVELKNDAVIKVFNTKNYNKEKDVDICKFLEYIELHTPVDGFTSKIESNNTKKKKQESSKREYAMRHPYITDIRREAIEEGRIEGRQEEKIKTAKKMLCDKLSVESVSKYTGLTLVEVEKLAAELSK
jgi:predicted transposase/invertase (TIGR01784 family)